MNEDALGHPMRLVSPVDHSREPRCETARHLLAPRMPPRLPRPPGPPPRTADRLAEITTWSTDTQERALQLLRDRELKPWHPFYCPIACDGAPHGDWAWPHARADQRPPPMTGDWLVWLLLGGRGSGKTRTGAEATHRMSKKVPRMTLIAPTGPDLRETMIEGESGVQATAPPDAMPQWEPSKKKLTWPNGAVALGFSGEEPDRLRGPQAYWVWIDEPAHMPLIGGEYGVWDNMMFGLRLGRNPWVCATTTPKPLKWLKTLINDPDTRVSRVSSYANLANLAPPYLKILQRYEGTRVGRQELHAEILEDVEGALWKADYFTYGDLPDQFDRIVVAVDPAGTKNKRSDLTGIVVLGIADRCIYVLADLSDKYSPSGWATAAHGAYTGFSADAIVAEKNYGGDMVREVLEKNGAKNVRIILVHSRRGKALRAEPIVALYERTVKHPATPLIRHLRGVTPDLEDEQLTWVPGVGDSPNRVDALVHGATELAGADPTAEISAPPTGGGYTVPHLASAGGVFNPTAHAAL